MLSRKLENTNTMREQHQPALPIVGQQHRHLVGHLTFFEVARQQRKSHQQQEQISQDYPFVLHMLRKASESGTILKSSKGDFVCGDRRKTCEGDLKRVMMKERNAKSVSPNRMKATGIPSRNMGSTMGGALMCPDEAKARDCHPSRNITHCYPMRGASC